MRAKILFRPKIIALLLFLILLMGTLSVFFFTRLDNIVHGDLYRYGLQFSAEWAIPYWTYSRLILSFLGVAMLMTCISIPLTLLLMRDPKIVSARPVTGILLIIGIAMFFLSVFFFTRLDNIVHGDLYRYGLQFSAEWAIPYWTHSRLILDFLAVAIGISGTSVVLISISTPTRERLLLPSPHPVLRTRAPMNLTRLTCYLLTSAGVIALFFSINFNSSIIALIGLGLIFWGVILIYIRPRGYVREILLDKTMLPVVTNLNQMIEELGYEGKGTYLPPKYFKSFESRKVYIGARKDTELPLPRETLDEDKMFIRNPIRALITPPGIELKRLFEKTLGTSFARVDLQFLEQNMPKLLVEDLEIAQEVEMETKNDRVFVKTKNSIYQSICKEVQKLSKTSYSLGCPLHSAIACALAEATGKLIVIEKVQTSADDQTTRIEYHILEPELEHTRK